MNTTGKVGVIFVRPSEYPLRTIVVIRQSSTIIVKRPEINKTLRRTPLRFGGSLSPNVLSKKGSFARFS
ncbi:MAG: hypothetical protein CVU46_03970 [Chloroflexi bacterium HGW-Chloroflexi-8]|nr:MAG: hypothetical protein CVU46_03970 [Chloroflexi bacterium HGW-Chloroflexi-8]